MSQDMGDTGLQSHAALSDGEQLTTAAHRSEHGRTRAWSGCRTTLRRLGRCRAPVAAGTARKRNQLRRAALRLPSHWPLDERAAHTALVGPSLNLDAHWNDDAIEQALAVAGGYPYLLQAVGKHVWDAARRSPVTLEDVTVGGELARNEMDEGLYRARWERATPAQKELLRAVGRTSGEDPGAIADLVAATGAPHSLGSRPFGAYTQVKQHVAAGTGWRARRDSNPQPSDP